MSNLSDLDSLFGDGGDVSDNDSLFGGDADDLDASCSPFDTTSQSSTVSQTIVQAQLPSSTQSLSMPYSQSISLLTLPGATTEAEAWPSRPVSCLAFPTREALVESQYLSTELSLALPSRPFSLPTPPSRMSTIPDPLDVPLSRQDGHTSGCSVVSTHHLTHPSPTTSAQVSDEEAELEALMEWELLKDQDVNRTSPDLGDHEGLGLDPKLIPGNRYANTWTRGKLPLPRRIDLQESKADVLAPFIFFQNTTKLDDLYSRLELKVPDGKKLNKALKSYLQNSPLCYFVTGSAEAASTLKGKVSLVKTALHILQGEKWGEKWFGKHSATASTRKKVWPADSTLITINFVALLHKTIRTQKQVQRNQARKNKTNDKWGSESIASGASSEPESRNASVAPQLANEGPVLLDALIRNVTSNKQKLQQNPPKEPVVPVEVPDGAELTYRVYAKDKTTGADLSPPTVYQHSNQEIANGAYAYLKSSFVAAGYSPIIVIHTANSSRHINNDGDWDSAVREIYWWRSRGGVVEVDILI